MSYGGLRGAVAFALVRLIDPAHVPLQPMFMTTTIAVIYFTVFVQGITIKPLVGILKVKRAEKRKPTMNERIHERVSLDCARFEYFALPCNRFQFMDHLMAGVEDILGKHGNHHVRDKLVFSITTLDRVIMNWSFILDSNDLIINIFVHISYVIIKVLNQKY